MPLWGDLLVAVALLVAAVGTVVPFLPGFLLAGVALLVWAVVEGGTTAWVVFALAAVLLLVGQVVKWTWPGRRLTRSGVPGRSIVVGGVLGIVGFFVVPVIGLPIGFVLGVYLAEIARLGAHQHAWRSTVEAMKATGLSVLVELASVLLAGAIWVAGLAAT